MVRSGTLVGVWVAWVRSAQGLVVPGGRACRRGSLAAVADEVTDRGHEAVVSKLESAVNGALRGEAGPLASLLSPTSRWSNPLATLVGAAEICAFLNETGEFLEEPSFRVTASGNGVARWVASGTWPSPWRPRAVVRGTSRLTTDGEVVTAIEDEWERSPWRVFATQVLPRFRDIISLYMLPPAELPLERSIPWPGLPFGVRLVRVDERRLLRTRMVDVTNSRKMKMATALPDLPFTINYRAATRTTALYAVSPLEVTVDLETEPEIRRLVTWDVHLPSLFSGSDDLPQPELNEDDEYETLGWIADPSVDYVRAGPTYLLVAGYGGEVQDREAEAVRRRLVDAAATAGLTPIGDRPALVHRQFDVRLVFDQFARLCLAAYLPILPLIPSGNQIAIRLEPPPGIDDDAHDHFPRRRPGPAH